LELDNTAPATDAPRFSLEGAFFYGPVKGYVQTPAGGSPGSTSQRRPRLGELGIHDAAIENVTAAVGWGPHEVFGGGEIIRLSGSDTLRSDLVSHGTSFAAGTVIHGDVTLDAFRVGYRYHLGFLPADNGQPQVTLAPSIDALFWNFGYTATAGASRASRSYLKPTVQGGINARYTPGGGRFSLEADLSASPPGISSFPFIASEQLSARYRFIDTPRFALTGLLGVRFDQMNFYDNQRIPNHIRADFGPMGVIGAEIRF
jgi:hypothetical protein